MEYSYVQHVGHIWLILVIAFASLGSHFLWLPWSLLDRVVSSVRSSLLFVVEQSPYWDLQLLPALPIALWGESNAGLRINASICRHK
jgi:hypothetical protein